MDAIRRALAIALLLSSVILIVELTGGILFRSTALTADALHIVTDILAVLFSFLALSISSRLLISVGSVDRSVLDRSKSSSPNLNITFFHHDSCYP
jgi:hypothetical protein